MEAEDKIAPLIEELGRALKGIPDDEKTFLRESQKQIDEAAQAQVDGFDRRLEFCYTIILTPDKIKNKRLIDAAKKYIQAAEKS